MIFDQFVNPLPIEWDDSTRLATKNMPYPYRLAFQPINRMLLLKDCAILIQ
jgi:hypothetical protein